MKQVIAYIKPHKLSEVSLALHKVKGLTGMSVVDVRGFGRGKKKDGHETEEEVRDFDLHAKIEIFCADDLVEEILSVIEKTAHTGLRGDGKIYVTTVETAVRITTGERGDHAV